MKIIKISILLFIISMLGITESRAQGGTSDYNYVDSLLTIDFELRKMFPRWKVCEADLQFQIYQAFSLTGFEKNKLNIEEIEVLASPKSFRDREYEILLITCGDAAMNAREIEVNIKQISRYLSGQDNFNPFDRDWGRGQRNYCFIEIPPQVPVKPSQSSAIIDYMQPDNKIQAMTLSLFEQSLKIGETGFWLNHKIGTEEVGYHFWSAGENKVTLRRPLMNNTDPNTQQYVPFLINARIGAGYRISSGIDNEGTAFSWVPDRTLNVGPGGKFVGGLDVHMPFHPQFGVGVNMEIPLQGLRTEQINVSDYGLMPNNGFVDFDRNDARAGNENYSILGIAPILRATGQFTLFYNWWLGEETAENFFRFDAGISYALIDEFAVVSEDLETDEGQFAGNAFFLERNGIVGVQTFKNSEFMDWLYFKVTYRNQEAFPFSVSAQVSNQIFLVSGFLPLFGDWFLLEAKYATPLRDARPFELDNFFMISPVLRITI